MDLDTNLPDPLFHDVHATHTRVHENSTYGFSKILCNCLAIISITWINMLAKGKDIEAVVTSLVSHVIVQTDAPQKSSIFMVERRICKDLLCAQTAKGRGIPLFSPHTFFFIAQ